jgi:hypothetical protein
VPTRLIATRHVVDCGRWLADRAGWDRYLWEIWRCQFPGYIPELLAGRRPARLGVRLVRQTWP